MRDILSARHRSFWLDGDLGGGYSWQRFIARLVAHGPVSEFVPGSMLQQSRTDFTMLGGVAADIEVSIPLRTVFDAQSFGDFVAAIRPGDAGPCDSANGFCIA